MVTPIRFKIVPEGEQPEGGKNPTSMQRSDGSSSARIISRIICSIEAFGGSEKPAGAAAAVKVFQQCMEKRAAFQDCIKK